jgi:hypothetical protein
VLCAQLSCNPLAAACSANSCAATSAQPDGCPNQNCIPFGSPVQQIVQIMHPSPACKPVKPIRMKFVGERCYGDGLASSSLPAAGIRWISAVPVEELLENLPTCSLSRSTGTSPEDLLFNQNYFGSCGVPPARVQYLAWGECPPPPPPPSPPPPAPPPPPPPRQRRLLPRGALQAVELSRGSFQSIIAVLHTSQAPPVDLCDKLRVC